MTPLPNVEQSYAVELARKGIHLCSLSIPIVYYFISASTALAILVPLTLAFALADLARFLHPSVGRLYDGLFGWLMRPHERDMERKRLNGATYVLLSATLCVFFFPKVIAITAFAILIVSDTSAALVGRRFGRRRFQQKSLEGTAAFFLSAVVVVFLAPKIEQLPMEYVIGIVGAAAGSVIEALPLPLDDNLTIPLGIGTVMWALYLLLLPSVNLYALELLR